MVLLSLAVVGVIPAFSAQVRGSALQDRFAGARRWIVSAGDFAVSQEFVDNVRVRVPERRWPPIRTAVRQPAAGLNHRPASWPDERLTVTGIAWWNGTEFVTNASVPRVDRASLRLQQISLKVEQPRRPGRRSSSTS